VKRVRLGVETRRAQLVELGLAEFGTRTYEEVSIDDIARRAGMSKGLLYHYFPTKRAYYAACVRQAASDLLTRMDEATRASPSLLAGLDAYLAYVKNHARAYATLMRGGPGVDREVSRIVEETRAALLERLVRGVETSAPAGKPALVRIALQGFIGLAEEASLAWVEHGLHKRARAASAEEVRDLLVRAFRALLDGASGRRSD